MHTLAEIDSQIVGAAYQFLERPLDICSGSLYTCSAQDAAPLVHGDKAAVLLGNPDAGRTLVPNERVEEAHPSARLSAVKILSARLCCSTNGSAFMALSRLPQVLTQCFRITESPEMLIVNGEGSMTVWMKASA